MKILLLCCLLPGILVGMDVEKNSVGQDAEKAEAALVAFIQRYEQSNKTLQQAIADGTFNARVYETGITELDAISADVCAFLRVTPSMYRKIHTQADDLIAKIKETEDGLVASLHDYLAYQEAAYAGGLE
jgi:hypothetical protein